MRRLAEVKNRDVNDQRKAVVKAANSPKSGIRIYSSQ